MEAPAESRKGEWNERTLALSSLSSTLPLLAELHLRSAILPELFKSHLDVPKVGTVIPGLFETPTDFPHFLGAMLLLQDLCDPFGLESPRNAGVQVPVNLLDEIGYPIMVLEELFRGSKSFFLLLLQA